LIDDWNDLRFVLAVAREGSFAAASKALGSGKGATKWTVARRIDELEARLGQPLFERGSPRMRPTQHALPLVEAAIETERRLQSLRLGGGREHTTARIRLWATEGMAAYWLPHSLTTFRHAQPLVQVQTVATMRLPDLDTSEADVAVTYDLPLRDDWVEIAASKMTFRVAASRRYLLAAGRPTCFEDLRQHPVLASPELPTTGAWRAWGDLIASHPNVAMIIDSSIAYGWATANGLGFAPQPIGLIERERDALEGFTFPEFEPSLDFYLICRRDIRQQPHIALFLQHLKRQIFEREPGPPDIPWDSRATVALGAEAPRP